MPIIARPRRITLSLEVSPDMMAFAETYLGEAGLARFRSALSTHLTELAQDAAEQVRAAAARFRFTGQMAAAIGHKVVSKLWLESKPQAFVVIGPYRKHPEFDPDIARPPAMYFTPLEAGSAPARYFSTPARIRITNWATLRGYDKYQARAIYVTIVSRGTEPKQFVEPVLNWLESQFSIYADRALLEAFGSQTE